MTETVAEELPSFPMPKASGCPMDPPPAYAQLRSHRPVSKTRLWDGNEVWLISGYDEIRAILSDPRIGTDMTRPGFPWLSEQQRQMVMADGEKPLGRMEPAQHTAMRRMLGKDFLIKRMQAMRPRVQALVDGLIDDMLAGPRPADLVQALAVPVTSTVIGWLLGVPPTDKDMFNSLCVILFDEDAGLEQAMKARGELFAYMDEFITSRESEPRDDLVSRLVAHYHNGELTRPSLLTQAVGLLAAGYDTTGNMISGGVLALLRHPDQAAAFIAEPGLVASATNELLRYLSVAEYASKRVANEDIEIAGETIKAGDGVLCLISSGNRDEKPFPDPDTLDIARTPKQQNLAFGSGVHLCLGNPLARMELEVVYATLFRRVPTLQLAVPFDQLVFRNTLDIQGVQELPVNW